MTRILFVFALAACPGKAPAPMDAPLTNQPFGATCTVVTDTGTECASGVCTDSFDMQGLLCSQKCTLAGMTDTTCPMGSAGQKCNLKGYCKP